MFESNPALLNFYLSQVSLRKDFKPDTGATSSPPWINRVPDEEVDEDVLSGADKTFIFGNLYDS